MITLGILLALDQSGGIELGLGWLGTLVAAILGTVLLISGLRESGHQPDPPAPVRESPEH